jgi:hypothetical protein
VISESSLRTNTRQRVQSCRSALVTSGADAPFAYTRPRASPYSLVSSIETRPTSASDHERASIPMTASSTDALRYPVVAVRQDAKLNGRAIDEQRCAFPRLGRIDVRAVGRKHRSSDIVRQHSGLEPELLHLRARQDPERSPTRLLVDRSGEDADLWCRHVSWRAVSFSYNVAADAGRDEGGGRHDP